MQSSSLRFARTVQALAAAARSLDLMVPGFRTPPRLVGVHRSIKRRANGATVAVVVRGRPWPAVQADLVEGVIAANGLTSPASDHARAELWTAIASTESPSEARSESTASGEPTREPAAHGRGAAA